MHFSARLRSLLRAAIADASYRTTPGRVRTVMLDKERDLYSFDAPQSLLHSQLAVELSARLEARLSPRVHSYRKGRSNVSTVAEFAAFVRAHARALPDPRQRGLYVLRYDIARYGESIPLGAHSPLWNALGPVDQLLEEAVRPLVWSEDEAPATVVRGVAIGSPIAQPIMNLYLLPLDEALSGVPGCFYARYGDDFIFAHPRAEVAQQAQEVIARVLQERQLRINEKKRAEYYFTAAGRKSVEWPQAKPTQTVTYLGLATSFAGTVLLPHKKTEALLESLEARLQGARRAKQSVETIVAIANAALDPSHAFCLPSADLLARVVTDRPYLRELDLRIAQLVAEAGSGVRGPRAFRRMPPKALRRDYRLVSLLRNRNAD